VSGRAKFCQPSQRPTLPDGARLVAAAVGLGSGLLLFGVLWLLFEGNRTLQLVGVAAAVVTYAVLVREFKREGRPG